MYSKTLKFIIVVLLSVSLGMYISNKVNQKLVVQDNLEFYYQQFVEDALEYDVNISGLEGKLTRIGYLPLPDDYYGLYNPFTKEIVINIIYYEDAIILKRTLYHELGHVLGLNHASSGIMQTYIPKEVIYLKYNPLMYGNVNWDSDVKLLFRDIKYIQK